MNERTRGGKTGKENVKLLTKLSYYRALLINDVRNEKDGGEDQRRDNDSKVEEQEMEMEMSITGMVEGEETDECKVWKGLMMQRFFWFKFNQMTLWSSAFGRWSSSVAQTSELT